MSEPPTCARGPGAVAACGSGHRGPTDPASPPASACSPHLPSPGAWSQSSRGSVSPSAHPGSWEAGPALCPSPRSHPPLLPPPLSDHCGHGHSSFHSPRSQSLPEGVLWIPLIYSIMGILSNSFPGQAWLWVCHRPSVPQDGVASPVWSGTWRAPWTELSVLDQPCVPGQQAACQLSLCRGRSVSMFTQLRRQRAGLCPVWKAVRVCVHVAPGRAVSEAARPLEVRRTPALFPGSTRVWGWNYFFLQSWAELVWLSG